MLLSLIITFHLTLLHYSHCFDTLIYLSFLTQKDQFIKYSIIKIVLIELSGLHVLLLSYAFLSLFQLFKCFLFLGEINMIDDNMYIYTHNININED